MMIVTSKVTFKELYRDVALEMADSHVEASRKEEGCISHQYYFDKNDANTVFFFEEWRDQEALDFHLQTNYSKKLGENFSKWVAGETTIKIYNIDSVKNISL